MPTRDLRLDEANELLAAWVAARAAALGIRALLLKGRPLADDGLREPRVSSDVDLLVEPARFDEYCAALEAAGWHEFPSTFASDRFTVHSRAFRREGWPNSLDVHRDYPGFLREPAVTFDALWAQRRTARFAHQPVETPSRAANALVLALHSLRGTHLQPRHAHELARLRTVAFTPAERDELAATAHATGATLPLADVLAGWGVTPIADASLAGSAREVEWRRKVAESRGVTASWLLLIRDAPWREKPRIVRHAVWPTRADYAVFYPEIPDRLGPQVWARVRRWGRGIRSLPGVLRALRRR